MAKEVYQWDSEEVSPTLNGVNVDGFQGINFSNGKTISHIRSVNKGVIGYNRSMESPSIEISVDSTANILVSARKLWKDKKYFNVSYTSPSLTLNASNCIIRDIRAGSIGESSPTVTISMLALKIDDQWTSSIVDGASSTTS